MHEALHGRLESGPLDAQVSHTLQLASFTLSGTVLRQRFHRQMIGVPCLSTLEMATYGLDVDEEG
jgi:hypothetical protein